MCGIIGAIGKSKHPAISHELLTSLLAKTEQRGDDATGFWAASRNEEGKDVVHFSKEPEKSTLFVQSNSIWKAWKGSDVDLVIGHCRKRTLQNGIETVNFNNHPFISENCRIALIHNGNVPEYDSLKPEYPVQSNCDSEVLLRILESGFNYEEKYLRETLGSLHINEQKQIKDLTEEEQVPYWGHRMMGLRDIFARVNHGAMAVAIAELWPDSTRTLWLFRNKERPLHIVDLRAELGQIFFVSTAEIWRASVEATTQAKAIIPQNQGVIEFPDNQVWMFAFKDDNFNQLRWKMVQKRRHDTSFNKERPIRLTKGNPVESPIVVTNIDLKSFEVIKPKPSTNTCPVCCRLECTCVNPTSANALIQYPGIELADEEVVLNPSINGQAFTEEEAKKSFLGGGAWCHNGKRVTVHDFSSNQRVMLKYNPMRPAIQVYVPKFTSDVKKNYPLTLIDHAHKADPLERMVYG